MIKGKKGEVQRMQVYWACEALCQLSLLPPVSPSALQSSSRVSQEAGGSIWSSLGPKNRVGHTKTGSRTLVGVEAIVQHRSLVTVGPMTTAEPPREVIDLEDSPVYEDAPASGTPHRLQHRGSPLRPKARPQWIGDDDDELQAALNASLRTGPLQLTLTALLPAHSCGA